MKLSLHLRVSVSDGSISIASIAMIGYRHPTGHYWFQNMLIRLRTKGLLVARCGSLSSPDT